MADNVQNEAVAVLKRIGGAWGWLLAFGILAVAAGVCMFFFTGAALYVIADAFGVFLIFYGAFRFVDAFTVPAQSAWLRALYALLSAISVLIGVYLLDHPVLSLVVLALTIGFFWIFTGLMELTVGIEHHELPHRGSLIFSGILGIVAGFLIVFVPGSSVVVLALLLGFWLVVYGLIAIVAAIRLRSHTGLARTASHMRA